MNCILVTEKYNIYKFIHHIMDINLATCGQLEKIIIIYH